MGTIYEPRGKAKEYADLALNLYRGCSHGCSYCWAPSVLRSTREAFHSAPKPRKIPIENIRKEAIRLSEKGYKSPVLLCFTCDPYQRLDSEVKLTREAIKAVNEGGLPVQILTKAGLRSARDFDLLRKNPDNHYAATLTFLTEEESRKWEPNAATPAERIEALKEAHFLGIKTWVSFEPVLQPEAVYKLIENTHAFVDFYKVGKLNYHPLSKKIDWYRFKLKVIDILQYYGKEYYLKNDLRKY